MTIKTISGAELKLLLQNFINTLEDDAQVSFGSGDLTLFRVNEKGPVNGPRMVQIEFNQAYKVTMD
ncbi:MAG: hypothetical protein RL268_88 [Pseudomonadota bacterium]|jgi:hypothetical protein